MDGVTYFGVRHLSPAAAFHLRRALDEAKPSVILVEGPSDLNDQMPWLCHPRTQYPVAIMAYTNTPPVRSILYPFAIYSPEIQAILWAHENNVPCRFMDLPSGTFLAFDKQEETPSASDGGNTADGDRKDTTESVYRRLELLTGEAHDAFWERHFEQTEDYQTACNAFGRELRASTADNARRTAENTVREAYMKRVIQDVTDSGVAAERIFCVCGAYHVEGLKVCEPMTDEEKNRLPCADSSTTLMPYSYYRLTTRSGYGAGNQAPAYFELLWDCLGSEGLEGAAGRYLVRLAAAHRKAGNIVSSAEVIEALRLAQTLASLRGSRYPVLQDLKDAAITTMGHGNHSELAIAFAEVEIGKTIGFLPEGVSRTSVQEDFYRQLRRLKLEKYRVHEMQPLDLDLREKLSVKSKDAALLDLHRSFFLHRLCVLGVHFASPRTSRQERANWGEYWDLRWTPEVEIEVVEASLLGDTVEGAADFALRERAGQAVSIDEAAGVFQDAFLCGMPAAAAHALRALQGLSVDAAALAAVAATAERLSLVVRYGDLRQFDAAPVVPLLEQLYLRACLTAEESCRCDASSAGEITQAIDRINALQLNHDFLDASKWISLLETISDRDDLNTKCSGFAMAVLLERGAVNETLLQREVARRLSPGVPAELGAGWFEGLAGKNRYALITRLSLWRQLSDYLDELDDAAFRRALVFLRRAFADFSPNEKSDIAENLGEIWGVNPTQAAEVLMNQPTEEEQAAFAALDEFDFDDI